MIPASDYLMIAIVAFTLAGVIKGTAGIGLPTAAIGILGQIVDPRLAIALTVLPVIAANVWQTISAGAVIETARKFWLFATTLVIFLLIMSQFVTALPTNILSLFIGVMIVTFSTINLIGVIPKLPERFDFIAQGISGVASGISGGLTGLWGPTMLIYFLARRTEKEEFVRAMGALLFIGGLPLAFGYWKAGLLNATTAPISALLIVPTLVGFGIGAQIRRRLDADRFRTLVLIMFLLMGLNMLRRALF